MHDSGSYDSALRSSGSYEECYEDSCSDELDPGEQFERAIIKCDFEEVQSLLREHRNEIDVDENINGSPPICFVAWKNRVDLLRCLLTAGANVNAKAIAAKSTALHYAASNDNVPMVRDLLAAGAKPEWPNFQGKHPTSLTNNSEIKMMLKEAVVESWYKVCPSARHLPICQKG